MFILTIFIVVGGPSIVIPDFRSIDDCKFAGEMYKEFVNPNPKVQFSCGQAKASKTK